MKIEFTVEGMSCSACSSSVERVTKRIDGVKNAEVNLLAKTLFVETDNGTPELCEKICKAIEKAGFSASPVIRKNIEAPKPVQKAESIKTRLILSIIFSAILMYISMGKMLGLPQPLFFEGRENSLLLALTEFILTLPVLYLNRKFYYVGFRAFKNKAPNMDSLVATGSLAAMLYGLFSLYMIAWGSGHGDFALCDKYSSRLYFDSAAMLLTLVTVGKLLEEKAKNKTTAAIDSLIDLAPKTAFVEHGGVIYETEIEKLTVGDTVIVKPGASVPCDGTVIDGESFIDEASLTGESIPVGKTAGDRVFCSTQNKNGTLKIKAEKVGGNTAFAKIIESVREAGASKAPVSRLADKVSAVFVPVVMTLAVITFTVWMLIDGNFETAFSNGVSVLVISCPCALGLATPVAVTVSAGRLAKRGILIKSAEALEELRNIDTFAFDKTGTVTEGKPSVTDVISSNEKNLLRTAYLLESGSEHPIASAICEYASEKNIPEGTAEKFKAFSGLGISAAVNGENAIGGNSKFLKQNGIEIPLSIIERAEALEADGKTTVYFALGTELLGLIAVADKLKPSAANTVKALSDMNKKSVLLTGDGKGCANAIGKAAGFGEIYPELMPSDKVEIIAGIMSNGKKVCFVGDGINDSPSLAKADIGIAVGSGTDIAIDCADIVLMKNSLADIPLAVDFSAKTMRNIKQNLFWAFFYNSLGIPVAAGVLSPIGITLNPMLGAAMMCLSSLFVVTNAIRLSKIKFKEVQFYEKNNSNKRNAL